MHQFSKKILFSNALDMLNEKILCLPSILLFERTVHKMNHPMVVVLNASIIQIIADVFNAPIFTQVSEYWPFFQLKLLLQTPSV